MEIGRPLRGIIVPLVTPLAARDRLDVAGLERLIEHVIAGGVNGIFILGTTGEGPSLSGARRREMIDRTCRQVRGRVPVLAGITDTSMTEALTLAAYAAEAEVQAAVYAGPCYSPVGQRELLDHIRLMAAESPLPLFLYNMPSHTHVTFGLETVVRAAECPNVLGLKDSSGNVHYMHRVLEAMSGRPDFSVLTGPEELLADTILLGGHGGVNGGANLWPSLYVELYRAAAAGDLNETRTLHRTVIGLSNRIYAPGTASSNYLKGLKCAMSLLDICSDTMADPYRAFGPEERENIARRLAELDLPAPAAKI